MEGSLEEKACVMNWRCGQRGRGGCSKWFAAEIEIRHWLLNLEAQREN